MEFELCPLRPCKSHQLQLLCHTAVDGKTATVNVNKKLLELLFLLPTYKRTDYIYGTVRHIGSLTDLFRKKRKPHVQIRCNLAGQSSLLPEEYKLTTSFYITPSVVAVETLLQHLFNVLMLQNILILGVKSSLPQQTRKYQLEGSGLFVFLTINYLLVKSCSFVWIVAKFEQKKRP